MEVKTGHIYHIKDEFFALVKDPNLMSNHEMGGKRPTYFTIKDKDVLWFIPLSSKVDKYQKVINQKIKRYGFCRTIMIRKIMNKNHAILLQNAFPTLEKYIDHPHTLNGSPVKVIDALKDDILDNFSYMLSQKKKGVNLFFPDIDKIKNIIFLPQEDK